MMKRLVIVALLGIVLGVMAQTAIDWTSMKTVRDSVYKAAKGKEFKTKDGFDYRDWVLLPLDALVIWCDNGEYRCVFKTMSDGTHAARIYVHGSLPGLGYAALFIEKAAPPHKEYDPNKGEWVKVDNGWDAEKFLEEWSKFLASFRPWERTGLRECKNGNPAWVPFLTQKEYKEWVKTGGCENK